MNENQAIIDQARQALTAISSDILFEPGKAATSLALAIGYLIGAFNLDADSVYKMIGEIADDTQRNCNCARCRQGEADWLRGAHALKQ